MRAVADGAAAARHTARRWSDGYRQGEARKSRATVTHEARQGGGATVTDEARQGGRRRFQTRRMNVLSQFNSFRKSI